MGQDGPKSLPDFQRVFPNESACYAYLYEARFPDGFACPYCGWTGNSYRFKNRPDMLRCRSCRRDTRLTAGTIMQRSKMPLSIWFWGAFLVTSLTPGMSALQFQKVLKIRRYETAFNMLHKLRAAMVRPGRDSIGGKWAVEVDETYVGGATQGEGRGRHHKTLVVVLWRYGRGRRLLVPTQTYRPVSVHNIAVGMAVASLREDCGFRYYQIERGKHWSLSLWRTYSQEVKYERMDGPVTTTWGN